MPEIAVGTPVMIIIVLITLTLTLVVFYGPAEAIFAKQEDIEKDLLGRISRVVQVQGEPNVKLESCIKGTPYNYKFRVTGLEAYFQGLPADDKAKQMAVFATLSFKDAVARDTQQKVITLTKGVTQPFGELEFDLSGTAPTLMHPDAPVSIGDLEVKQSLVLNNYKITAIRQFKPLGTVISAIAQENCYTDFFVQCKTESAKASLTSCKEDLDKCKTTLVLCGARVDLQILDYKSGNCNSRPLSFFAQANKQVEGWEYSDSATINFWRSDSQDTCWKQTGYTPACAEKFLGSKPYNLTRENYNVGGCVPAGFL